MLTIRRMIPSDAAAFETGFAAQGWHKPASQYEDYLAREAAGVHRSFVAELDGAPVGYVLLLPDSPAGPFAGSGVPCLSDFNVFKAYQRRGIGTALLDAAEAVAAEHCDRVCLGVGMHSGYGAAQRLYVLRGYVPDGSGLWYNDAPAPEYGMVENGDELVLYMMKNLK